MSSTLNCLVAEMCYTNKVALPNEPITWSWHHKFILTCYSLKVIFSNKSKFSPKLYNIYYMIYMYFPFCSAAVEVFCMCVPYTLLLVFNKQQSQVQPLSVQMFHSLQNWLVSGVIFVVSTSKGCLIILLISCYYSIEIFKTDVVKCTVWKKQDNKNTLKTETQNSHTVIWKINNVIRK